MAWPGAPTPGPAGEHTGPGTYPTSLDPKQAIPKEGVVLPLREEGPSRAWLAGDTCSLSLPGWQGGRQRWSQR